MIYKTLGHTIRIYMKKTCKRFLQKFHSLYVKALLLFESFFLHSFTHQWLFLIISMFSQMTNYINLYKLRFISSNLLLFIFGFCYIIKYTLINNDLSAYIFNAKCRSYYFVFNFIIK